MLRLCTVDSCSGVTRERAAAVRVQAAFRRAMRVNEEERIREIREMHRSGAEAHLIDEAVEESHRRQQDSQRRHTAEAALTTIQSHARRTKGQKEAEAAELAKLKGQGTRTRTQSFFPQTTTLHSSFVPQWEGKTTFVSPHST